MNKINKHKQNKTKHNLRLCSLLFDNAGLDELCGEVANKALAIPTYKFLPPMYQLAARLGTSGNLNQLVQQVSEEVQHSRISALDLIWLQLAKLKHALIFCPSKSYSSLNLDN